MTKRTALDGEFLRFGGTKLEVDRNLYRAFARECDTLGVTRKDVLRQLLLEFLEASRAERGLTQ